MVHPKRKRHLAFEQLDNRIAMNSDMDPSASIAMEPLRTRDFIGHLEIRSVSFVTSVPVTNFPTYAVVQHVFVQRPLNPQPPPSPHRTEPVRLKVNVGMRAPAEGESSRNESVIPSSPSVQTFGANLAGSNGTLFGSSLTSTSSSVGATNLRFDGSQPGPLTLNPNTSGSALRELVASNSTRMSSPAPLVDATPAKSGVETVANTSQKAVLQSQSDLIREPIASTSTPVIQIKSLESAQRSETTASTENGMLTFTMRETAVRSTENRNFGGLHRRNGYRTLSNLQLLQMAEADRLRTEMAGTSKRLPTPKGMIEIDDSIADNSQKLVQSIVSRASNNPFEILQLFVGSTNMVQAADGLASQVSNAPRMIGTDSQGLESTEMATKEDSILALAVGVVFAMAFRKNRSCKIANPLSAIRRKRILIAGRTKRVECDTRRVD